MWFHVQHCSRFWVSIFDLDLYFKIVFLRYVVELSIHVHELLMFNKWFFLQGIPQFDFCFNRIYFAFNEFCAGCCEGGITHNYRKLHKFHWNRQGMVVHFVTCKYYACILGLTLEKLKRLQIKRNTLLTAKHGPRLQHCCVDISPPRKSRFHHYCNPE